MTDKKNDFDYVEVENVPANGLQIYQQDKAFIDMQIATAKQYPRDLKRCIDNAITMVTMDFDTAKKCNYSLSKGGKNIQGPSVHLAKIIAQSMGNMRIENRVVGYDATHVTCEAICFDLEKNFAIRTQIKRSIVGKEGRFSEDMCVIIGNAGNSIALRNAIFAVVDASIVEKVYSSAKAKITGDISDEQKLISRKTSIIEGLLSSYQNQKLTEAEILKVLGRASFSHIDANDIITLIGFENSLKSGEQSFDSIFRKQGQFTDSSKNPSGQRIEILLKNQKTRESLSKFLSECTTPELKTLYDDIYKTLK